MNRRRAVLSFQFACALCLCCVVGAAPASGNQKSGAEKPAAAGRPKSNAAQPAGGGGAKTLPPPGNEVAPADRAELEAGVAKLGKAIESLRVELKGKPDLLALLPDVQIYHNAVRYPLVYHELIDVKAAHAALGEGQRRAEQLAGGAAPWANQSGPRGYVSRIDGSVQPYMLQVPKEVEAVQQQSRERPSKPHRLDLFCHGRDEKLTELSFISKKVGNAPAGGDQFVILLYGRYCNANKFAGEIDCLEAIEDVKRRHPIDENRIVLTGFSMGGAAAWHFAVHYADVWAAVSPGAGFAETAVYQKLAEKGELDSIPWYQKSLWHLYDCPDYVVNLTNCPTIAYAGEIDPQKQSSDIMIKAAEAEGVTIDRIIGPKTAHAYEKGAKAELDKRLDAIAAKGRNPWPEKVRFATWTLRYNRMFWVTVDGMEHHWRQARVDADRAGNAIRVKTQNVTDLTLSLPAKGFTGPPTVEIDGERVAPSPAGVAETWTAHLTRKAGKWAAADAVETGLRKRHGLQGPIDDAFMDSFLIVRPTGKAMNEQVGDWTMSECDRAIDQWRKIFRGEARVKNDTDVTDADIAAHHLVLFGDPSSNKLLARIAGKLPVRWDEKGVTVGAKNYAADHHVPVLCYPNPLNPARYVVLNSGFTFREADHSSNSRQVPKLPDWAVIDVTVPPGPHAPGRVADAGFFGERWELQPPVQ